MSWPSSGNIDAGVFDSDADKISVSRPEIYKMAQYVNDIVDEGPFVTGAFSTVSANGVSLIADSTSDTLTITPGAYITITADANTDTLVISSTGGTGGTATANINMNGYSILDTGGLVQIADGMEVKSYSLFKGGLMSNSVIQINSTETGPGSQSQRGLSVSVNGDNSTAIIAEGSPTGSELFLSVNDFDYAAATARTLDGYLTIKVDGATRYLPYYL